MAQKLIGQLIDVANSVAWNSRYSLLIPSDRLRVLPLMFIIR